MSISPINGICNIELLNPDTSVCKKKRSHGNPLVYNATIVSHVLVILDCAEIVC